MFAADSDGDDRAATVRGRLIGWYLRLAYAANRILDPSRGRVVRELPHPRREVPFEATHEATLSYLDDERANVVAIVGFAASSGEDQASSTPWHTWAPNVSEDLHRA